MKHESGEEDCKGVHGWDETAVLDVMSKKDRAQAAYDAAMRGDDIGLSDEDAARWALAAGITAGLGYGAYKIFGGGSSGEKKPSGPWLYKMNPSYWFKSSAEKRYIDIEKSRGQRNVELNKELSAAERAYWTSHAAAQKESQVKNIESQLKQHGAVSGEEHMAKPTFWTNEYTNLPSDEVRLSQGKKRPFWKGAFAPLVKENAAIGFDSPDDPADWNSHFSKFAARRDGATKSTMSFRPSKTALGAGTEFSTVDSTVDPTQRSTEFRMSGPGTEMRTVMPTVDPTLMSTAYKMTGIGADFVGDGKPGASKVDDKRAVGALKAAGVPTMPGAILSPDTAGRAADALTKAFGGDKVAAGKWLTGFLERTQISWYGPDGAIYAYRGGRRYIAAPPAPADVSLKTTAMRGDSSFVGASAAKKVAKVAAKRQAVGASAQGKFISQAAASKSPIIAHIAGKLGLIGKRAWTAQERDSVAASLLNQMMTDTKAPPSPQDAHVARQIVKVFGGARGVTVAGDDDEVGFNPLKAVGTVVKAPFQAAWWGTKQVGKGLKWTGQQLGIVKKPRSAAQRKQAALIAAAKRRAAAAARIRAAERKHEAAVLEREQARKIADEEAAALDAEAAAQEAEAIAIEAEAMKDVADVPAIEGDVLSGESAECCGVTDIGFWSVVGNVSVPVGKAALAAATPTKAGAKLRTGAAAARAAKTNPAARAKLVENVAKAKAGDKVAQQVVNQVKAGATADAQRLDALKRDAGKKRSIARRLRVIVQRSVKFYDGGGWPGLVVRKPRPISFTAVSGPMPKLIRKGVQPKWVSRLAANIAKPKIVKVG